MVGSAGATGGYPLVSTANLPVANLSASARWRALGGSEGAPQQLEDGCRWIGAETAEINSTLILQCSEGAEAGKITDLNFHFKFVQQIAGLEPVASSLRTLDLSTNNISCMEGLTAMVKLRELKLYSCQISRIQNLEQCVSLMALHLEDNRIGVVEGLDTLRSLEYLNLDSNRLQRIGRALSKLTKLRELHLSRNQLTSLDGIAGLASLETCSVEQNRLSQITIEQVKGLVKVDELRISGNQLQSLSFLMSGKSLPNLVQLDVSNNKLSAASLQGLPSLPQLVDLNLADNLIEEISPNIVCSFPSLEILDLANNQLHRGAEDVEQLKQIASLRELLIKGNPFTSQWEPDEMQKALDGISFLELLDDQILEKPVSSEILALEEGDDDTDTFRLTVTKGVSAGKEEGSRPASGIGSRPSTGNSRPGTAQKMSEAGVRDPLMHTKPKLSDKRFASEEQVETWERQTISSLQAVQKQIDKTCQHMDADLQDMTKYLRKADEILEKGKVLNAKRPISPDADSSHELPSLRSATVAQANANLAADTVDVGPRRNSRVKFRLKEALEQGQAEEDAYDDDNNASLQRNAGFVVSPGTSPSSAAPPFAAYDEEIEEDGPPSGEHCVPSPEPEAQEVEEELHGELMDAPPALGPRASRAMATVAAANASRSSSQGRRRPESPDLHVDARVKERASQSKFVGLGRPSSRGSQGSRPGSQPSQGPRTRPPAAPSRR